jgi:hypothetical protein
MLKIPETGLDYSVLSMGMYTCIKNKECICEKMRKSKHFSVRPGLHISKEAA